MLHVAFRPLLLHAHTTWSRPSRALIIVPLAPGPALGDHTDDATRLLDHRHRAARGCTTRSRGRRRPDHPGSHVARHLDDVWRDPVGGRACDRITPVRKHALRRACATRWPNAWGRFLRRVDLVDQESRHPDARLPDRPMIAAVSSGRGALPPTARIIRVVRHRPGGGPAQPMGSTRTGVSGSPVHLMRRGLDAQLTQRSVKRRTENDCRGPEAVGRAKYRIGGECGRRWWESTSSMVTEACRPPPPCTRCRQTAPWSPDRSRGVPGAARFGAAPGAATLVGSPVLAGLPVLPAAACPCMWGHGDPGLSALPRFLTSTRARTAARGASARRSTHVSTARSRSAKVGASVVPPNRTQRSSSVTTDRPHRGPAGGAGEARPPIA